MTHTQWTARARSMSDGSLVITNTDAEEVCVVRDRKDRHYGPQDDADIANASLIAAAPDLLAALVVMVEEKADYMRRNNLGDPEREGTTKQARDAIDKATGQS